MSLISQNAVLKRWKEKPYEVNEKEVEKSPITQFDDETEFADEPRSSKSKKKKKSGDRDELSKAKQLKMEEEAEMKGLESFLFGALYSPLEFGNETNGEGTKEAGRPDSALFFMDKSTGNDTAVYEEELYPQGGGEEEVEEERKPVWVDDEEERTTVDISRVNRLRKLRKADDERIIPATEYVSRQRAQHAKLNPWTDWAKIGRISHVDDESDDESGITIARGYEGVEGEDVLRSNEELVVKDSVRLLPGLLEYSRLVDANAEEPSNGPVNSVQFHRNGQLLLTAGLDRWLRFFQIDGKRNTKIQSIFVEDCPVHKASFLPDGSEVIIAGRRKFFYSFDLVKAAVSKIGPLTGREEKSLEEFEISPDSSTIAFVGNEGYILLVSSKTKELIGTLKMNGTARSLAFVGGGKELVSSGGDGHVYHWDLRTRKCIHKGIDEGSITSTALCSSPDSSLFAAGSSSGVVNVYKREEFLGGKRKPLKTIENVPTVVDAMTFNPDAQILAICSGRKKNGLKLVHVPSFNVFSNWPGARLSLQYPRCLDFSPGSGFMTVGTAAGKVLLYKLHHYRNA